MNTHLLFAAALALAAALVFAAVGLRVLAWRPTPRERTARDAFAIWWFCFAGLSASAALQQALAAIGSLSIAFRLALLQIELLALSLALGALMYYLLYVYTGSRRIGVPLALFYGSFYLFASYFVAHGQPASLGVGAWNVGIELTNAAGQSMALAFAVLLLAPLLVGVLLYSLLYFRVREPAQKRRVAVVSGAFFVWFGASAVAVASGLNEASWWPLARRIIGLGAAVVVLAAFRSHDAPSHPEPPSLAGEATALSPR